MGAIRLDFVAIRRRGGLLSGVGFLEWGRWFLEEVLPLTSVALAVDYNAGRWEGKWNGLRLAGYFLA